MGEVQLIDLTADELLSIIAVLTKARVRLRAHQPNNVVDFSAMQRDAMGGASR